MDDDDDIEIIEDIGETKRKKTEEEIVELVISPGHGKFRAPKIALSVGEDECDDVEVKKKRPRRDPETVLAEKLRKAEAQAEKKKQREEAKLQKENEKKKRQIEREAATAQKSKAEQYTYCYLGEEFLKIQGFELAAKALFAERKLEEQLIFENSLDFRVEFRRKQIEMVQEDKTVKKLEYTCLQHIFGVLLEANTFKQLVLSDSLDDFVIMQQTNYSIPNSQLILICYGEHKLPVRKVMETSIALFEETRTHIEFFANAADLALFLVQTVRALAKKVSSRPDKLIVDIDKGIDNGTHKEIVEDWWNKMLIAMGRLGHAQRRAIVRHIPDPMKAMKDFRKRGYDVVTKELSNLVCENGRRLGPAMAARLFVMLTDTSGIPIID